MDELVRWFGEQLDIDAARATAAAEETAERWDPGDVNLSSSVNEAKTGAAVVVGPYAYLDRSVREHIAAHDPARVLGEIEVKRQIIALWKAADEEAAADQRYAESYDTSPEGFPAGRVDALEDVLRLLALPYSDRPGYQESWRP